MSKVFNEFPSIPTPEDGFCVGEKNSSYLMGWRPPDQMGCVKANIDATCGFGSPGLVGEFTLAGFVFFLL